MKKISPAPNMRSIFGKESPNFSVEDMELAKKFNEKYYHWDEIKYKVDDEATRDRVWSLMKINRLISSKRLSIGQVNCSFSLTSNILELLFELERRLSGHLEYQGKEVGGERMRYYSVSSFAEEAISSSILEGAAVTRLDAKRMIRKKQRPVTEGERMVMNNYLAMENIKKIKGEKLTPELIKEMHRIISNGTLKDGEEWEGRFRESNDVVVGDNLDFDKVFHVPPTYDKVPKMIEGLCDFCNKEDGDFIHPLIRGIIIHFMIGYIHPFVDGNGRLARSLFYWYTIKKGYWMMEYAAISKIIKSSQSKYGMAYQYAETDENDLTYFIIFNLECIIRAVKELEKHVENKLEEQKKAIDFVSKNPHFNLRQATILKDYLKDRAPFSIIELQQRYRCAYQTIRLDVMDLESRGLVRRVARDRKKVLYVVVPEKMSEYAEQKEPESKKSTLDKARPVRKNPKQKTLDEKNFPKKVYGKRET